MFNAKYVLIVMTDEGMSIEDLTDLEKSDALAVFRLMEQSQRGSKVALYKKVKSE